MTVPYEPPVDWLLETGDAWVQYRTRLDLLGQPENDPDVQGVRAIMLSDPRIQTMIETLQTWPSPPLTSHKKAAHPLHLLSFLAEIGLRAEDPGMATVVERVLERQSGQGAFQITVQVKKAYGGTGQPMLSWFLCDAPLVLWAMLKLGVRDDARMSQAVQHLVSLVRENGWPCATDPVLAFRGPGRKADPCPYATLLGLKALALYGVNGAETNDAAAAGVEALLAHWHNQSDRKLYMFGVGTDFRKPKFPLVWYDILHVLDVLSHFPTARHDPRYQAMLGELVTQMDKAGRLTAASMYQDWKDWEFANKKQPSPAISLIAWRAARR